MTDLPKLAVIGAGTMGAGIAGVFARLGYEVALFSRSAATLDKAREALGEAAAGIRFSTELESCLEGAGAVSENVAEELELKRALFSRIEAQVPDDCLLTTNTSSVPIGAIAAEMTRPERLVGLHWFNPPAVMPLVEIVRGPQTAEHVVERARALCGAIGKETIEVATDLPGFVINRLQYAILREALHLVESGVATIRDVDRAVETTLAPRWCAAGPLRLMDLAGLDTVAKVAAVLMPALHADGGVPPLVARLAGEGAFGTKSGRGFYEWTDEASTATKAERDAIVTLLTERRRA
ncbi:3-hydroxybutyryl-CoA dehydrogenase [Aureimonas endophytica]|uniref:3-hydroxybutyryl-CoA dehydrogenase n=1 Tax=Aureimonas endophytica TaxID=2027858 RepID=A0A916ZN91_9HYPH|nr:3-hydroxyacyl-CoA dehydrogenase family protein [Aureimonas endophytica]GGE04358.1 3-hydroxybutyryl-CoA dehydrogenase [Aureimonas endophytica]